MTPPPIVIDTREQRPLEPWRAARKGEPGPRVCLPTTRAALAAGDYSVQGLEHIVAIERKSIPDLWGTLYGSAKDSLGEARTHQDRFRAELERLQGHARRWWLVEGYPDLLDEYAATVRHTRVALTSVHALIASIACDYGIPVLWSGGSGEEARVRAGHLVGVILGRIAEQHVDVKAAAKVRGRGLSLPWLAPEVSNG
jgi:ERCC4-type nuclease